jgi:hypothetical protein
MRHLSGEKWGDWGTYTSTSVLELPAAAAAAAAYPPLYDPPE